MLGYSLSVPDCPNANVVLSNVCKVASDSHGRFCAEFLCDCGVGYAKVLRVILFWQRSPLVPAHSLSQANAVAPFLCVCFVCKSWAWPSKLLLRRKDRIFALRAQML